MMLKIGYILLGLIGILLPDSQFIPFTVENGLDFSLFWEQLFANQISSFFGLDVIVSSVVFFVFVFSEGSKLKMRFLWVYILSNLLVGVSFGLPLFLLMRQDQIESNPDLS